MLGTKTLQGLIWQSNQSSKSCSTCYVTYIWVFLCRGYKAISNDDLERFIATFQTHAGHSQVLIRDDFSKMLSTKNVPYVEQLSSLTPA